MPEQKKPYVTPTMISEDLFESKAMACGKLPTGVPGSDCEIDSGGMDPNNTS